MSKNPKHHPCARDRDTGAYIDHARQQQAAAAKAYTTWVASLSPKDRLHLQRHDLITPPTDEHEVGGHSPYSLSDIADTPLARTDTDYAREIDRPHEILADEFNLTTEQARAIITWHHQQIQVAINKEKANYLQIIVGGLLSSKNPKLNAAGLAFAAGLAALNGLPCQREYARINHVSRQAISKVVKSWQESLDLHPSAHQKSQSACQTYSHVGKTNHWRDRHFKASMATKLLSRLKKTDPSLN